MTRSCEAALIRGAPVAAEITQRVQREAERLKREAGIVPGLAVVLAGSDPASELYVRKKSQKAEALGIRVFDHGLPHDCSQAMLLELVERLNGDAAVHGILLQLPLPSGIETDAALAAVDPAKDVDGFHPLNRGLLAAGDVGNALIPCTPLGCMVLLRRTLGSLAGLEAVVVGRSNIVGKPMAQLLLQADCTVTAAHSRTRDLPEVCRRADILVAAVGKPNFIRGEWLKPGATVVDVGINRAYRQDMTFRVVGDVMFQEALQVAKAVTPVPGGIGPMTIACLMANTVTAAFRKADLETCDWFSCSSSDNRSIDGAQPSGRPAAHYNCQLLD